MNLGLVSSKLVKLRIIAYAKPDYSEQSGQFQVMLNPQELSEAYRVCYAQPQGIGTSGSDLKFHQIQPSTFQLNLLFDGTGVLNPHETKSVPEQIQAFKEVAVNYQGEIHSPYYLQLSWGSFLFKGCLTHLEITYTLFQPDGTPLRAKAKATFRSSITPQARSAEDSASSPDVTHERTVKAGDTLPMLSQQIYNDPTLYLQLAEVNQLDHFRQLTPGMKITFPPLEGSRS